MKNEELLLAEWNAAKINLTEAQETEKTLRIQVAEKVFGFDPDQLQKGTATVPLPNGYKAKITFRVNESLEQNRVNEAIEELQGLANEEQMRSIFSYKASVSARTYRTLCQEGKDVIDSIRSFRPGVPSLEIVSPKEKRGI